MNDNNILAQAAVQTEMVIPEQPSVGALAESSRAQAEIQAALIYARANPRDMNLAVETIRASCQRPSLAENSSYEYSRGGTSISGPNIRLMEVIATSWGNLQFG